MRTRASALATTVIAIALLGGCSPTGGAAPGPTVSDLVNAVEALQGQVDALSAQVEALSIKLDNACLLIRDLEDTGLDQSALDPCARQ